MTDDDILDVMPNDSPAKAPEPEEEPKKVPSWEEEKRELERKLKKQTQRLHNMERTVKSQEELHRQNLAAQREKILRDLEAKKVQAIQKGDAEAVVRADREMKEADQEYEQKASQVSGDQHPEYARFVEQNDWYDENKKMRLWANAYAAEIRQESPNLSLREMFTMIGEEARKEFPEHFMTAHKGKAPAVESPGTPAHKVSKENPGWESIPRDYRPVFEAMWRQGAWGQISKREAAKKYASDLVQIGVIEE